MLELVVEKTGYPRDMLDLDLDLEADLGVDTVKQAEMFAAIREIYGIPRDENLKLRDFPTLAHVIQFVYDKRPDLAAASLRHQRQSNHHAATTPVAAPAAAASAVARPRPPADDSVKEKVLEIVAEKTGYPKDMLDLDLDLEADLGVDTVKQAEMFAAIREAYNIPRDENLKLRDFPTLAHVIQFVYDKRPDLAQRRLPAAAAVAPTRRRLLPAPPSHEVTVAAGATDDSVKEKVLEFVAEKTGYPKDMLDLDLDLEADLGVDTVKQAEMFAAVREIYNIPRDENLKLRDFPTLAHVIQFVFERRPGPAVAAAPVARPRRTTEAAASTPTASPVQVTDDSDQGESTGDRRREDRLSQGHAGPGSRSGSRSRRRHRQAGGDVRRRPERLQHSARREPEAARLPDPGARDSVRARPAARAAAAAAARQASGRQPSAVDPGQAARRESSPASMRPTVFRAACRYPPCARRSPSASQPA